MKKLAAEKIDNDYVALFPDGSENEFSIDRKTQLDLYPLYGKLYDNLINKFTPVFSQHLNVELNVAELYVRVGMIPVVNLIIDRGIRLSRALNGDDWEVANLSHSMRLPVDQVSDLLFLSRTSFEFNQSLLIDLAKIFGVNLGAAVQPIKSAPDTISRNNLFDIFSFFGRFLYLSKRVIFSMVKSRKGYPSLGMAYSEGIMHAKGFYATHLKTVKQLNFSNKIKTDPNLRNKIFDTSLSKIKEDIVEIFRVSNATHSEEILGGFNNLLKKYFPISLIEGSNKLLLEAEDQLKSFDNHPLIFSSFRENSDFFYLAAARKTGRQCIGVQHGGHYGYIANMDNVIELEIKLCDTFLSWGWGEWSEVKQCKFTPLPYPWLTERAKHLKRIKKSFDSCKHNDILIMPNKVYRFPLAIMNGGALLADQAKDNWKLWKEFVSASIDMNMTILNKPYDLDNATRFKKELKQMARIGGNKYSMILEPTKGLDKELLSQSSFVVWDAPGTGFLECLVSNIPVIVIWNRGYCMESDDAKELFKQLEDVGIIQRSPIKAAKEIKYALKDLDRWMGEPKRISAINAFTYQYARIDTSWTKLWKKFLHDNNPNSRVL